VPHLHIGLAEALKIFLLWLLIAIPWKLIAIWLHNTRIGQAMAFAV
jgi:hypothetical protein